MGNREIRDIRPNEYNRVLQFIKKDNARNYFIRLGLEGDKDVYKRIIGEVDESNNLKALLFKRKSGNLQFYGETGYNVEGFSKHISHMEFKSLISPSSYCDNFLNRGLFASYKEGAFIGKLSKENKIDREDNIECIKKLTVDDLDNIVKLYKKVFNGFTSKEIMKEKLKTKRGRGYCIYHNKELISVAQSEFEDNDSAVVVGVATDPKFQKKGLASKCLKILSNELQNEDKDIYLQYDNKDAGKIYEKLGFIVVDRVRHYFK
ncbi:GNAT family N-acetyltransferase [Dethiothermospora halolimnae]|uniref:GNAT family N-acetyltransferase n=1 Tax=Dethiothermospora halolimnae TaxID=3114390 RepID=UPI003CCBFF00